MEIRGLLKQTYRECEALESLRRQRDMVLEDHAGLRGISYDSVKVSGGKGSDLTDTLLHIQKNAADIDRRIALALDKLMEHRARVYELLAMVPDGYGKSAVEEHYLFHTPWAVIAAGKPYSRESIKRLAYQCIRAMEEASGER